MSNLYYLTRSGALILLTLAAASCLHAVDLASIAGSDVILIGEEEEALTTTSGVVISIKVSSMLKGDVSPNSILAATLTISEDWRSRFRSLPSPNRGLWFLQKDGRNFTIMPLSDQQPLDRSFALPLDGAVHNSEVAPNATGANSDVVMALAENLKATEGKRFGGSDALRIVKQLSPESQSRFLSELASSSAPCVRTTAVATRLVLGDLEALDDVVENAKEFSRCETVREIAVQIRALQTSDASLVRKIGLLTEMDLLPLSTAATEALERIHSRESIPFLMERLGDPSPVMRTWALRGLFEYASSIPDPRISPDEFRRISVISYPAPESELNAIAFWRQWYAERAAGFK